MRSDNGLGISDKPKLLFERQVFHDLSGKSVQGKLLCKLFLISHDAAALAAQRTSRNIDAVARTGLWAESLQEPFSDFLIEAGQ